MNVKVKTINIGDVKIPVVQANDETWYPISYLSEKIFLRQNIMTKQKKVEWKDNIKKFTIDFTETLGNGGKQTTNCIERNKLKEYMLSMKTGWLTVEQSKSINNLLEHLDMDLLPETECIVEFKELGDNYIKRYDEYVRDCIKAVLEIETDVKWQKCIQCNNYYPYHGNFFRLDNRLENGLTNKCRECCKMEFPYTNGILHVNRELVKVKSKGMEKYIAYKNNDIISIYNDYLNSDKKSIPRILSNKESYLMIIKHLYDSGNLTKETLSGNLLKDKYKLNSIQTYLKMNEIYDYLFKGDELLKPWLYPKYKLPQLDYNQGKNILNTYINEYKIIIEDLYDFHYYDLLKKCKLSQYENNWLGFIMYYYDNKYPAYKFKGGSINYWKEKEHRVQALKYLIEEDMKLSIEKVPLYLTKNNLRKRSDTLYNLLTAKKYYNNSLFDWVNEVYPDRFVREDFEIGQIRNVFDSIEEEQIYNYLKDKFDNVIYNQNNCDNTIKFKGKVPDYIVITENYTYIIEYFGLYVERDNNSRIRDYIKRSNEKMLIYEGLAHKKIYLFPEDLENNMAGVKEKVEIIV